MKTREDVLNYYHVTDQFSDEEYQIRIVSKDPYNIRYINNPSEKVQLAALREDASIIKFLHSPSEAAQLYAFNCRIDDSDIQKIKNPCEKLQLKAIKVSPFLIKYFANPSKEVQLAAVKAGLTIDHINLISDLDALEELCKNFVTTTPEYKRVMDQ